MFSSFVFAAPNIWILGDSYIRRGEEAARKSLGPNLGLDAHVRWFGRGGLRWHGVLPFFSQALQGRTVPDVLLIHCGGNDLGLIKSIDLVAEMKQDLCNLHRQYTQMRIIFSAISQRPRWRYADPKKIQGSRVFVNNVMASFVLGISGSVVHHPRIVFNNPELFLKDQVHLSARGNEYFLNDLAVCLKTFIQQE